MAGDIAGGWSRILIVCTKHGFAESKRGEETYYFQYCAIFKMQTIIDHKLGSLCGICSRAIRRVISKPHECIYLICCPSQRITCVLTVVCDVAKAI